MTRGTPPADWVAYVVVLVTVVAMLFGKYLMGRGDKNEFISTNNKNEDLNKDDKS